MNLVRIITPMPIFTYFLPHWNKERLVAKRELGKGFRMDVLLDKFQGWIVAVVVQSSSCV